MHDLGSKITEIHKAKKTLTPRFRDPSILDNAIDDFVFFLNFNQGQARAAIPQDGVRHESS